MKIRLFFCLLLLTITMPIIAQDQDHNLATVYVFNAATTDILIGQEGDIRQLAPNDTTTLYLPINTPVFINDGVIPLGDDYLVGHRYAFAYLGAGDYTVTDITDTPSDETTSVWWIGNFLGDATASLSVTVNGKPIIPAIAHGTWASFVAPITYFDIAFSVGDVVLYQTDQAFGEPYYTALIGFAGDYTGSLMRDFFPNPDGLIILGEGLPRHRFKTDGYSI